MVPDDWRPLNPGSREGRPVSLWRHATGAVHLHWQHERAGRAFGISFDTPATDDSGLAHVLEHWIGAGSVAYPMSSALLTTAFRCGSGFLNGFTENGRTACTFTADDGRDHLDILDVVLDAVYRPLLSEREFLRESCRAVIPPAAEDTDGRPTWTGVVFNEMLLKPETDAQWVTRLMARHLHPDGHEQYRHEGVPAALTELSWRTGRAFHQCYYQPQRAFSFATGPELPETLTALAAAHRARQETAAPDWETLRQERPTPLHAPDRLRDQRWAAGAITLPGGQTGSWQSAFEIYDHLTASWQPRTRHGLVCRPVAIDTSVVVVAAVPAVGSADFQEEAGETAELREQLRASLTDWRNGRAADDPAPSLLRRLTEPYKTLPPDIAWGLALAGARAAGLSPQRLVEEDDAPVREPRSGCDRVRDLPPHAQIRLETRVLDPASQGATPLTPPSAERCRADGRVWRQPRPGQDASCLPLRGVAERPALDAPRMERLDATLELLTDGPPGVYGHVLMPVAEDTSWLLWPLVRMLLSYVTTPSAAHAGPQLVTADPRVRMDGDRPVLDLVLSGWTPAGWRRLLDGMAGFLATELGAKRATACVRRCLDEGSWRLVTSPHELAESAALGMASVPGASQDAVNGLPAMVEWRRLVADDTAADACLKALTRLGVAPLRVLAVGSDAVVRARSLSRELPTGEGDVTDPPVATPVRVSQGRDRFAHAVAWPLPPELDPAVAAVLAADLRRRIAHQVLREDDAAYGAHAFFDERRGGLCLSTHADPVGPSRSGELLGIVQRRYDPPTADDLETARVMAARSHAHAPPAPANLADLLERALRPRGAAPITARRLVGVTADDLLRAARRHLSPDLGHPVSIN